MAQRYNSEDMGSVDFQWGKRGWGGGPYCPAYCPIDPVVLGPPAAAHLGGETAVPPDFQRGSSVRLPSRDASQNPVVTTPLVWGINWDSSGNR